MWQFLETSLQEATPIILAALAAVFAARAGIFHLGLEGLMIIGAFASVAITIASGSAVLGVVAAVLACLVFSALFWFVTVRLRANVIIAGLALTTVGLGATTYALEVFFSTRGTIASPAGLWQPFARTAFPMPNLSIVVLLLPVVVFVCWLLLRRSSFGLAVASIGQYPYAARSAGIAVDRTRLFALLAGGVLCALAGSQLALGGLNSFSSDMSAGRGFIAFSAAVLGASHPLATAGAGLFFGFASTLGIQAQLAGWPVPVPVVLMVPYILTVVAVAVTGVLTRKASAAQAAFGELRE